MEHSGRYFVACLEVRALLASQAKQVIPVAGSSPCGRISVCSANLHFFVLSDYVVQSTHTLIFYVCKFLPQIEENAFSHSCIYLHQQMT